MKLKLLYFGHLMWRANSLEKTLVLGKIEGRRRRGDRGWGGWMASLTQWTWVWVNSRSWWWTRRPGVLQSMGLQRVGLDWTELNCRISCHLHDFLEMTGDVGYLLAKNPHRGVTQEAFLHIQKVQVLIWTEHRAEIHPELERMMVMLWPRRNTQTGTSMKENHQQKGRGGGKTGELFKRHKHPVVR